MPLLAIKRHRDFAARLGVPPNLVTSLAVAKEFPSIGAQKRRKVFIETGHRCRALGEAQLTANSDSRLPRSKPGAENGPQRMRPVISLDQFRGHVLDDFHKFIKRIGLSVQALNVTGIDVIVAGIAIACDQNVIHVPPPGS